MHIGIICSRKTSDALICKILEAAFPHTTVVRYLIPPQHWITWPLRRIRDRGLFTLLGNLLLSGYIRAERFKDKLQKKTLWTLIGPTVPSWAELKTAPKDLLSETALIHELQDCDIVIALDALRLSHRFYRKTKARFLQVVWGDVPNFMGDSGAFWEYAVNQPPQVAETLIERMTEKGSFAVRARVPVPVSKNETLRTLKIKQVGELIKKLPSIISGIAEGDHADLIKREVICSYYYAPTIFTYLQFLKTRKLGTLPRYALRKRTCTISTDV